MRELSVHMHRVGLGLPNTSTSVTIHEQSKVMKSEEKSKALLPPAFKFNLSRASFNLVSEGGGWYDLI